MRQIPVAGPSISVELVGADLWLLRAVNSTPCCTRFQVRASSDSYDAGSAVGREIKIFLRLQRAEFMDRVWKIEMELTGRTDFCEMRLQFEKSNFNYFEFEIKEWKNFEPE